MLVSRCCHSLVYVEGSFTHYYVCNHCHHACDVVDSSKLRRKDHESRNDREIEKVANDT